MNTLRAARLSVQILLWALAAVVLVPLVWLVAASLKSPNDLFHYTFFSPRPTLVNFRDLLQKTDVLPLNLMNSVFITCTTVLVQLFFSSLSGFALAKYQFRGKGPLMLVMIGTLMIPGQLTMAPLYELLFHMRLLDTYAGLIVPGAVSVFGIFLFRQSMLQVPDELLHAGRVDGCSEFRLYWDIVMPVSRPMVGAFCLISFVGIWNSFLWPQIILHQSHLFTLPIALNQMVGIYGQQYGMLMAGTLISVLPVIALFLAFEREFVAGLTSGAIKG